MPLVEIINQSNKSVRPIHAELYTNFNSRFRGLMFRPSIQTDEGIILVENGEDRLNTAIHMFFMRFDIAVFWLDQHMRVVDTRLARRWQPIIIPRDKAQFVIETHPERLQDFEIGDQVLFKTI
jgi:uncharacterized membrane protein (UPF0127 family)